MFLNNLEYITSGFEVSVDKNDEFFFSVSCKKKGEPCFFVQIYIIYN